MVKVSASEKLLQEMTGRQIMHFLEKYGPGAFRRKGMMIEEGIHWILGLPSEIRAGKLSKKIDIGVMYINEGR